MENLSSIVGQLKRERDRVQQQLSGLNAALAAFAGVYSSRGGQVSAGAEEKTTSHERQGPGRNSPRSKSPMGKSQGRGKKVIGCGAPSSVQPREAAAIFMFEVDGRDARPRRAPARLARCAA